jgi:glycosyltransferase involved in cell wall biosynthesis
MTTGTPDGPLVSIVTPAYNQGRFLRDTVDSVLRQDYRAIEYIVIDDGSTDSSSAILAGYGERITWLSQANQGQTPTINRGWSMARGQILGWLNSDDTLLPGAVRCVVDYFHLHRGVGIVFGDTLFTDECGRAIRRSPRRSRFDYLEFVARCENPIPQPSAFIRREVLSAVGLLDPTLRYFMDWEYWLRAGLQCDIAYLPALLSTYRLHATSNTIARSAEVAPELGRVYEKFFARDDLPVEVERLRRRAMVSMLLTSGGYAIAGADRCGAIRSGLRALRADPAILLRWSRLRQVLYCLFGTSWFYRCGRTLRLLIRSGREPTIANGGHSDL